MTSSAAKSKSDVSVSALFIDGQWRLGSTGEIADDLNPATGEVIAQIAQASPQDVEDAIASAYRARTSWASVDAPEREAILLRAASLIEGQADEIRDLLVEETGSAMIKAPWEVGYAVECLRVAAGCVRRPFGDTFPTSQPGQMSMTIRQPLGVIAGIAPFNSPLLLGMKKVAFALAAGNTFILKPSELAPLVGLRMARVFEAAGLPRGVLNVIPGAAAQVADQLVSDSRVRMISFTGSTRVGHLLAAECGKHMKRVALEMGGKSPLVVLADADLDYAVNAAAFGSFFHQGQVCMASSRIIVEDGVYEEFCENFVRKAQSVKVGDPRQPDTVIGPLIRPSQAPFIKSQIEKAVALGARLLCGGGHTGPYFEATVLADVTPDMPIYQQESFGPVTSVIRARDYEHALNLANDTNTGLSSAIVTNDMQKALDFSRRSESGMVHINDATISDEPHIAFGGVKDSGFGREGGMASIDEMSEIKWISLQIGKRQFPF